MDTADPTDVYGIGIPLRIKAPKLKAWLEQEGRQLADLRLFVGGLEFAKLKPSCDSILDPDDKALVVFQLSRVDRTEDAWRWLLDNRKGTEVSVPVSIGFKGGSALPSQVLVKLTLINRKVGAFAGLGLAVVLLALLVLAKRSDLLRDDGPSPEDGLKPYSLARCQMAWWTIIVLGGFLLLSLFQGTPVDVPAAVLGLMGIAAGTFVGARFVPKEVSSKPQASRGFVKDLLSDGDGITLHRFQIFIWTIALGITFLVTLWSKLEMPDLSTNLVGLMGISNATYLGFKFSEDSKTEDEPKPDGPKPDGPKPDGPKPDGQ